MTGRTHDLAALTALGGIVLLKTPDVMTLSTVLVSILANQIGGILPDIDQPTAPLWRNLPIVGGLMSKIVDKMLGGHRFISHSLLGLVLFGFLGRLLLVLLHPIMTSVNIDLVWWAFIIGVVSHLAMDTLTKEGVPWLLPIPIKIGLPPIKSLRITTGKSVETLIIFPALLITNIWFYTSNYHSVLRFIHINIV